MSDLISIRGSVEMKEGTLALVIPLETEGRALAPLAKKISYVEGNNLVVQVPDWLAAKLEIHNGSLVQVDNLNGKFTITKVADTN